MLREVLVVDDDADLRNALAMMLEAEGHVVLEAEHGQHALELMSRTPPHLIILDLTMPVMDGRAFLQAKAKGAHRDVPVVVFSSTPPNEIELMPSVETVVHKLSGVDALIEAVRRTAAKLAQAPLQDSMAQQRLSRQLLALGLLDPLVENPCAVCGEKVPLFSHLEPALCLKCLARSRGFAFTDAA
jgi:CheY-like chemotaxis protein